MQNPLTFFQTLVEAQYSIHDITLHSLNQHTFDWRGIYRISHSQSNKSDWVLRACRQDSDTSWLLKPAATLLFLEQQHYPAPRIVRTLANTLVGTYNGWWTLMTTFVEGNLMHYTPEHLRLLGNVVGKLHMVSLTAASAAHPPVQASWWQPTQAVPECLLQLAQVSDHIPQELQPLYDGCIATLERIQHATSLPITIIHGDCWPGNAVCAPDDRIVLIDWDCSGFGPPILDLGNLLLNCHFEQLRVPPFQLRPNPAYISAIITGYCQQRQFTITELEVLEDAIRFGVAFHFACNIGAMLQGEWQANVGLQKLRARYEAAEEIARIA